MGPCCAADPGVTRRGCSDVDKSWQIPCGWTYPPERRRGINHTAGNRLPKVNTHTGDNPVSINVLFTSCCGVRPSSGPRASALLDK